MKKIMINDGCIGCGACIGIDPEHFEFNDDGLSEVINQKNLETEDLQNAIESCPVQVINITEIEVSHENLECECSEECCCTPSCNCEENSTNNECECECEICNCTEEDNCGCDCFKKTA